MPPMTPPTIAPTCDLDCELADELFKVFILHKITGMWSKIDKRTQSYFPIGPTSKRLCHPDRGSESGICQDSEFGLYVCYSRGLQQSTKYTHVCGKSDTSRSLRIWRRTSIFLGRNIPWGAAPFSCIERPPSRTTVYCPWLSDVAPYKAIELPSKEIVARAPVWFVTLSIQ